MVKHSHVVNPQQGYIYRKPVWKNDAAFAEEVRLVVHKLADLLNLGAEKGIRVHFNVGQVGNEGLVVPVVEVLKEIR